MSTTTAKESEIYSRDIKSVDGNYFCCFIKSNYIIYEYKIQTNKNKYIGEKTTKYIYLYALNQYIFHMNVLNTD